jgi:hypothetical protein
MVISSHTCHNFIFIRIKCKDKNVNYYLNDKQNWNNIIHKGRWNNYFKKVKLFIEKNKYKLLKSKDNNIKELIKWINIQHYYYYYNKKIMKDNNIKIKWEEFINKYQKYFISNENLWDSNLEKVKLYINKNNCRPSSKSNDYNIKKMGYWLLAQQKKYTKNMYSIKDNYIKIKWENFINEYKKYFLNNEEIWNSTLEKVKLYIDENKYKPLTTDKDNNIKQLAQWINIQQYNYKNNIKNMKDKNIRIKWNEFINQYKKYLLSNEEVWDKNLEKVILYINENKCRPLVTNKDDNIKLLAQWINVQKHNYFHKKKNMKNNNIKIKWMQFIDKYKQYFYIL